MNNLFEKLGVPAQFDANHSFVTSPLFSPFALAIIRLTLGFYTLFTAIFVLAWEGVRLHTAKTYVGPFLTHYEKFRSTYIACNDRPRFLIRTFIWRYFSFFTELSYIGLCAYFCASGVQTLIYALSAEKKYPLQRWAKILQFLHVLLFSTISTFRKSLLAPWHFCLMIYTQLSLSLSFFGLFWRHQVSSRVVIKVSYFPRN